jgi:cyclic 2,3-diphosphoglycerate synthetase
MGPFRMLLADFVVVTMCEYPFGTPSQISAVTSRVRDAWRPAEARRGSVGEALVVRTVFRPTPTRSVEGAAVFVVTTAAEAAGEPIRRHLEGEHGCRVVGMSNALSDRARLLDELAMVRPSEVDVLLCEVKAAGIDVATRWALERELDVIYMDNVPHGIDGDSIEALVDSAARLADERFRA